MTTPTEPIESTDTTSHERRRAKTFVVEIVIGVLVGLAVLAALVTSTAEIPFVYQGY